jgi:molybdopterin-guanine dinucleotide biosynthesis protein A
MIAGVLLTGGASRRMHTDKASIVWRGETLAARAGRVLGEVCTPVLEIGSGLSGLSSVREDPPGSGPLAALVAGARAIEGTGRSPGGSTGPILLLACDLPFVEAPVLRLIAGQPGSGSVVPRVSGRLQFACARYGRDVIERAKLALDAGERSLRAVVEGNCTELSEAEWALVGPANSFADVDTPEDLRRLGLS